MNTKPTLNLNESVIDIGADHYYSALFATEAS